jgi:hypothetical protein
MIQKQKNFLAIIIGTIVLSFLVSLSPIDNVIADAAPEPGGVATNLSPNPNQTQVRMESETVQIDIAEQSDYWNGHAIVTATFYMRNLGDETEEMKVRFPMNSSDYRLWWEAEYGEEFCGFPTKFPSIDDVHIKVNDENLDYTISTKTFNEHAALFDEGEDLTRNCWAHFDVTFPPNEQVVIQVQYKVGGYKWDPHLISYKYVLQTGSGWDGTIGSADISINLPYELNDRLIDYCRPEDCLINENSVSWHYEDFEPVDNIELQIVEPAVWLRVLQGLADVEENPEDGPAWGRLANAYKDVYTERHGYMMIGEYPEYFQQSLESYQRALTLLPDDVDLHWDYKNVICGYAFGRYTTDSDFIIETKKICANEISTIAKLDPEYEELRAYLNSTYYTDNGFITSRYYFPEPLDLSFILTPGITFTTTPISSRTPLPTLPPVLLVTLTSTPFTQTPTQTEIASTSAPTPVIEIQQPANSSQNRLLFSIAANILFIIIFLWIIRPNQSNKR